MASAPVASRNQRQSEDSISAARGCLVGASTRVGPGRWVLETQDRASWATGAARAGRGKRAGRLPGRAVVAGWPARWGSARVILLGGKLSRESRVEGLVVWGAFCKIECTVEPNFL
jgi:hypothetical protein